MENVKNVKKKEKKNRIFLFVFALFAIYFVYTIFDQQIQINKYDSQIEMYLSEISNREEQTRFYKEQAKNITSDEYIEQVARDSLGYVKPYEKVFIDTSK